MTAAKDDLLLHYYAQELAYLRQAGVAFAERYPKVGARLQLDETTCPDPHVERLIESFAFLTGRIQYNIDAEFPLFTSALLENLYPGRRPATLASASASCATPAATRSTGIPRC